MVSERSHCMLISVLYCHETRFWKIADFGLTAEATSRLAVTTRFSRGTAGYRAPELLTTSKFTNKADIWALGSIIYELTMGRKAFCDDFAVQSYSDSRSTLQLSIPLVPENHLKYLSECVYEMLVRNPEQRPSISIILGLVKSYCMLLDLQSLEELKLIPPYDQWKELVGEKPREVTGFLSDLVGWYHSAKRNDALIQVFTALVKRYSDVKELRQQLAYRYDDMSNWNTRMELWKDMVDENPSEEALHGKLTSAFLSSTDCRPMSQVLKELAEKHPENIQMNNDALIAMAKGGSFKDVSMLLDRGASVAATDGFTWTPLHHAAWKGHKDVVELLLDRGASVAAMDRNGLTPLHHAAWKEHKDVFELLLDRGASVVATDRNGLTPLHYAAWKGHEDMVALLLDRGASVAATNGYGLTPLHHAAWKGHKDVVELLLDRGASVTATNGNGVTPLHQAAWKGHKDVVELLLVRGGLRRRRTVMD